LAFFSRATDCEVGWTQPAARRMQCPSSSSPPPTPQRPDHTYSSSLSKEVPNILALTGPTRATAASAQQNHLPALGPRPAPCQTALCFLTRRLRPSRYPTSVRFKVNICTAGISPVPVNEYWARIHFLWFTKDLRYLLHGHAPAKTTPATYFAPVAFSNYWLPSLLARLDLPFQVGDSPLKLANQLFKLFNSAFKLRGFCLLRPRLTRRSDDEHEKH
jgi:hypothetical protein